MSQTKSPLLPLYRILMIEPNLNHQELIANLIFSHPQQDLVECHSTRTLEEAYQILEQGDFKLIVCADLSSQELLPKTWLPRLRTRQSNLPIIILTSSIYAKQLKQYHAAGATDVIIKNQEAMMLLPQLIWEYLVPEFPAKKRKHRAKNETTTLPAIGKLQKIFQQLNHLNYISEAIPGVSQPLNAIRRDLAHVTKMVKELLQ